ncbi:MAG: hypothetical protein FJW35_17425 [Acidobacteria bacterium]|nr:hypothetical protein [Acidobacteriota bacterium]
MNKVPSAMCSLIALALSLPAQQPRPLKVFISVDMEGIAGLVSGEETGSSGKDYDYFRRIMTREAGAAVEGALAAGASEVIVRDGHGSKQNILPDLLPRGAQLLRGNSGTMANMMDGLDGSFGAAVFIGYHARAGTPDAILDHTSTGNVTDFAINGVSLPEGGYNALIAGLYDVPVVFVAGDQAICAQMKKLLGAVEAVATKQGVGAATIGMHPETALEKIRAGVETAVRERARYRPYQMSPPYTLVLKLKNEESVYRGQFYPGARRTGDWEITFTSNSFLELMHAFNKIK